jgi:hypothetical protein
MVAVQRISDEYVWLKGVHPSYLAELREVPGDRGALSAMSGM